MKASYQMSVLPQSGVQATIEGALLRLLFDFSKPEPKEGEESEDENDIYDCESVDVKGRGYGDIVSAIMNDRYSSDSVQAIMANYADALDGSSDLKPEKRAEYIDEYDAYQQYRRHAKSIANTVLTLI